MCRFLSVLSFHQPENLAAVLDGERAAYHIDLMGRAAYHERFLRTFGFYCGLAGVQDNDGLYFHILQSGKKHMMIDMLGSETLPGCWIALLPHDALFAIRAIHIGI